MIAIERKKLEQVLDDLICASSYCNTYDAIDVVKEALAQDEKGLFIDLIAQHEGLADELAQPDYRAVKTYHEGKPVYVSQPEQEPVAWEQFYPDIGKPQLGQEPVAIYRAGQAKGEGFHVEFLKEMGDDEVLLYTTPPQRPWAGLTDEEIKDCMEMSIQKTCRAVEAKLKEKNFG